ncbi:MAG: DUF488 domain-containing protein [Nitrospirota bacterium]
MAAPKKIYTLGTDLRSEEDFVEILLAYYIQAVVDVRSFPTSRIATFKRENLSRLLVREGIEYHYLGREIGGFRKGGYIAYTLTDEFKQGVTLLESIAESKIPVIICAERFPWKCHRRWISREMQKRGWEVIHIIDKGKVWAPK